MRDYSGPDCAELTVDGLPCRREVGHIGDHHTPEMPDELDVERLTLALWGMRLTADAAVLAKKIAAAYARHGRRS